MKQINVIGGTLTAVLSLSVIVACDSRGVTAMKSRRFSVEEQAVAKSMRDGQTKTVDAKSGTVVTPSTKSPVKEDEVSDDQAGQALAKVFTEVNGTIVAKKSELLAIADQQLGTINEDARKRIKGLTLIDKSQGGKWIIDVEAVIVLNGRQQNLFMNAIEVVPDAKGRKDFRLTDRFAANAPTDEAPDLIVGPVCQTSEGDACTKAILMLQWGLKSGGGQYVVIEIAPGQTGAPSLRTNVGPIKSFTEASNAPPEDGELKPKATLQDAVPATMPTKAEAKAMSFKEFSARYRAAKAATPSTAPAARFPRINRSGVTPVAPPVEPKTAPKPEVKPTASAPAPVAATVAAAPTAPKATASTAIPAGTDPVVHQLMLDAEADRAKKAEAAKVEAAKAEARRQAQIAADANPSWYASISKKIGSVLGKF